MVDKEKLKTITIGDSSWEVSLFLEPGEPLPDAKVCEIGAAAVAGNELWVVELQSIAGLLTPYWTLKGDLTTYHSVVGQIVETGEGQEILTTHGWVTIPDKYLGVWPTEEELPEDDTIPLGAGMLWRGELQSKTKQGWTVRLGSPVPSVECQLWERAQDSGFEGTREEWEKKNGVLNGLLKAATRETVNPTAPEQSNSALPGLRVLGPWPNDKELPDPNTLDMYDAYAWRDSMWVLSPPGIWMDLHTPSKFRQLEPEHDERLNLACDDDWHDKGSLARMLLETRKENKRLKRNRLIAGVLWRLLFAVIIGGLVYGAYLYVMSSITTGRYTDERSCKVSKGNLTISGKRTFSYPYKTLFGFRLVDENKVLVDTVMNVNGDKITVVGLKGNKTYWQNKAGMGEKGIMILKDADIYLFQTDKELIVATSDGFCNPIQRELDSTELKQPVLDIIK
jgi:hypothetical protein